MGVAVVSLTRTKTGRWYARKAIPADVRGAYGKREEKQTWEASLTEGQAKAELASWLAPIEDRITLLRAAKSASPVTLTSRQCAAMAGEWYRAKVADEEARFTDVPGAWDWEADIAAIRPDDDESWEDQPLRPIASIVQARDALLRDKGLAVTPDSAERLLQGMLARYLDFLHLMQRRCEGDFGPDPVLDKLPTPESLHEVKPERVPQVSLSGLFEEFAATGAATAHTVGKWRAAIASFVDHLGHDDAAKVTRADAHAWFDSLLARGLSVRTVRGTYRSALARVFKIAFDRGRLASNAIIGLEVIGPKVIQTKRKEINDSEAALILKAALGPHPKGLSKAHALARRWVPWICAYTGARVNEITQLRAMDIRQEDGVWVFHITPEAGSVKTRKARSVPIHSCLIEQGVLDLAKAGDQTPLFYDLAASKGGSERHPPHTLMGGKLAKWVRGLGITEVESPNHGWRHRFKTLARVHGMNAEARDRLQGHAVRSESEAYGGWPAAALRAEVEKLPGY